MNIATVKNNTKRIVLIMAVIGFILVGIVQAIPYFGLRYFGIGIDTIFSNNPDAYETLSAGFRILFAIFIILFCLVRGFYISIVQ